MPDIFDPAAIARHQARSRARFADHDFLHRAVVKNIVGRRRLIRRDFSNVLMVGREELLPMMRENGMGDVAPATLESLAPDTNADLIFSILSLHTVNDVPGALTRLRAALRPDGLFLGAVIGGDSLRELRHALGAAEIETTGAFTARVAPTIHLQDMAALMQRAGFALPVVDHESVTVTYDDPMRLLHDLRGMGEGNPFPPAARRWLGRRAFNRMRDLYRTHYAEKDGRVPATFDILYLCGWAPHDSQPKPLKPGSATHRLADVLAADTNTP